MKHSFKLTLIAGLFALSTGCASIVSDSSYPVAINSTPPGAHFKVFNQSGAEISNGTTPNTVSLKASAGYFDGETYKVEMSLAGYQTQTITVDSSIDGWYVGNILFGGLIGWLIVDPLTGAMYKLPDSSTATLSPDATVSLEMNGQTLTIAAMQTLPASARQDLVPLK